MPARGHSAKNLKKNQTLPSASKRALGKDFFKKNSNFAERRPAGTRQRFFFKKNLCRVLSGRHSAKFEFFLKKNSLPSALWPTLSKVWIFFKKKSLPSAMVLALGKARKTVFRAPIFQLCRVLWPWHLATGSFAECNTRQNDPKRYFFYFFTFYHNK